MTPFLALRESPQGKVWLQEEAGIWAALEVWLVRDGWRHGQDGGAPGCGHGSPAEGSERRGM